MNEAQLHFLIWAWSSIGLASDDAWRCERSRDSHHPFGHRLWDGTLDDLAGIECWHGDDLVTVPPWWVLYCAPNLDASASPVLARRRFDLCPSPGGNGGQHGH